MNFKNIIKKFSYLTIYSFFISLLVFANHFQAQASGKCCRVNSIHPEFNCSILNRYGEERCNLVWTGGIIGNGPCKWVAGRTCPRIIAPRIGCCMRSNITHPEYNCSYWTSYGNPVGKNRCNAAWTGGIPGTGPCSWETGLRCLHHLGTEP